MGAITEYKEERVGFGEERSDAFPAPGVMWVFMKDGTPYSCDFLCPCGCGASCYTVFGQDHPRKWEYTQGQNGPTLHPSIRFLGGCKAHFNIVDGKVIVHGDSGK